MARPSPRTTSRWVRLALGLSSIGLSIGLSLGACGRPQTNSKEQPRKIQDPDELPVASAAAKRQNWRRAAPPMPETFAAFPHPDLAALDGIWIVESDIPGERVVWVVEDEGATLTTIDRRGTERVLGITLTSPCAVRLTDNSGRAHSRAIALQADRLLVSSKGGIAVSASDGSLLACVGHRTYQVAPDGRCRFTTEMLGVWSELSEPSETCQIVEDKSGRTLMIGPRQLRERDGLWVDDLAASAAGERFNDRDAALASLLAEADDEPAPASTDSTGTAE